MFKIGNIQHNEQKVFLVLNSRFLFTTGCKKIENHYKENVFQSASNIVDFFLTTIFFFFEENCLEYLVRIQFQHLISWFPLFWKKKLINSNYSRVLDYLFVIHLKNSNYSRVLDYLCVIRLKNSNYSRVLDYVCVIHLKNSNYSRVLDYLWFKKFELYKKV